MEKTYPVKWNPEKCSLSVQLPGKHKFLLPNHFMEFETIEALCDEIYHNYLHTQYIENDTKSYDNVIIRT